MWISVDKKIKTIDGISVGIVPVGKYGEGFAKRLALASQLYIEFVAEHSQKFASEIAAANPQLVRHTARGNDYEFEKSESIIRGFAEGIISMHQMIAQLTAEKVEGFESGEELLKAIIFNGEKGVGITTEFAKRLPQGVLGPLTLRGQYLRHPLKRLQTGKVALSEEFIQGGRTLKEFSKALMESPFDQLTNLGCPLGYSRSNRIGDDSRKSDLQRLIEIYWKFFEVAGAR